MIDAKAVPLIQQKLVSQAAYIAELRAYVELDYADYQRHPGYNRAVERLVQIIVESAIDANEKLLEAMREPPAASARESFEAVHRLGAIDDELWAVFRKTYVGLRNRIVHDYEKLDGPVVYSNARRLLDDATRYITAVRRFIAANSIQEVKEKPE